MKRLTVSLSIFLFIFAFSARAQHVSGHAGIITANTGRCCHASNFNIKFCKANADSTPSNLCSAPHTLSSGGIYGYNVGLGDGYYYAYFWRDDTLHWGSDHYPRFGPVFLSTAVPTNQFTDLDVYPRAHPPQAVYPPEGAVNVNTTFVLQWTDGLDDARRHPSWPVTYDIYGTGNEFPEVLVYENVPCGTGNTTGTCSIPISGLVYTTRYQWRVVARMRSGPIIQGAGLDNSYRQSSGTFKFSTTWDPAIPVYTIRTENGNLIKAANGGGGAVDATGSGSNYETQFQFQDPNGGSLFSGDPIYIRTNRNHHISAVNGGGSGVNAVPAWTMNYETWVIERVAGFGPISPGDQVAFKSYSGWYLSANLGGGSSVNAAATAIGPWETFTFQ